MRDHAIYKHLLVIITFAFQLNSYEVLPFSDLLDEPWSQASYISPPVRAIALWSGHARKQSNSLALSSMRKESRHKVPKSVSRAALRRMQFTLHATRRTPHGASRLVQALSAWLVKIRRAPSRHSRDARVYGNMTTAIHKLSTPPPPPPVRAFVYIAHRVQHSHLLAFYASRFSIFIGF